MQANDITRLRIQPNDIDSPGEGLQIGVGANCASYGVHSSEGIFVAVEIGRLKHRPTASFEHGLHRRIEIRPGTSCT